MIPFLRTVRARFLALFLILSVWLTVTGPLAAQVADPPVEVSRVIGGQVGFIGAWAYGEFPLGSSIVARVDAGLDSDFSGGSGRQTTVRVVPVVSAGPRWYYNLKKRSEKGKRTAGNAANFVSLPVIYHPGWFTLSNYEGANRFPDIALIPTWGIRRNLGESLNFEVGIGVGYLARWNSFGFRNSELEAWIPLRFGF